MKYSLLAKFELALSASAALQSRCSIASIFANVNIHFGNDYFRSIYAIFRLLDNYAFVESELKLPHFLEPLVENCAVI